MRSRIFRPSPAPGRALTALVGLTALATVVAVISCWKVGWLSDDWEMLAHVRAGALFEEARHVSLPRRLLWWGAVQGAGPWLFRLVGLGCHLVATLGVLPRVAGLMFPVWAPWTGYVAGLVVLGLPVALEPLVWASAVAYPILELELLAVAYAHLRWLRDGGRAWRVGSLLATAAALLTWELGVAAPLVVAAVSGLRARKISRGLRDVAPHALLVVPWFAFKLGLGSTDTLIWRGSVRLFGHLMTAPLLALSPWHVDRDLLTAWPGMVLAGAVLALVLAAAWSLGRPGAALLLLAWATLAPVLVGPGPEARYLLIAAPWLVLLATAGVREVAARCGRAGRVALTVGLVVFCAAAAATSWRSAERWRAADGIARAILDDVTRTAHAQTRPEVVVIDAPDRLPGWGPTSKVPVWRHGLAAALAMRGVRLAAQAHTPPGDPEVLGLQPSTRPWGPGDLRDWRARGLLVLICRPDGRGGYQVVPFGG
jgi:hypothetical protein